jgi:DNA-binding transcriptional MerR regulator
MHIVSSGSFRAMQRIYKQYLTAINLLLILLLLSACADDAKPKESIQPPFKDAQDLSIDEARKIAKEFDSPDMNVNVGGILDRRSLAEPKEIKFKRLFDEKVIDPEQRFLRLETQVQNLSDKFSEIDPAVTRLLEIEKELDDLTQQLKILISAEQPMMIPQVVEQPEFMEVKLEIPEQTLNQIQTASGGLQSAQIIHDIRIADHPDKTRIVFDMSDKIDLSFNLQETKNLAVSLPANTALEVDLGSLARKSSVIKSSSLNPLGNELFFSLNQSIDQVESAFIGKGKGSAYHRFYIDLKK